MSMHISAAPGEIAENVILPGDPLRAKYIAETYLTDAVRVNEIRNTWGYTGPCFYSIHQILRHAEQFHVLLVNALHTQPVAVFPHHMLSIPLLQQNLYHFTTLSFIKQEAVHF